MLAEAGIQKGLKKLDSRFHGNDNFQIKWIDQTFPIFAVYAALH
jgi:hypothetical protein